MAAALVNGELKFSDLIGKPVVDADSGERIGRAWDIRVRRDKKSRAHRGDERLVAVAVVIKSRGALERFGFLHLRRFGGEWRAHRETIAWDRIQRIDPGAIVVRGEADG